MHKKLNVFWRFWAAYAIAIFALAAVPCRRAEAIIYARYNHANPTAEYNITAPPDDPGWDNVPISGSSVIYLGNQWVLTAGHVAPGTLWLANGEFTVISGTNIQLTNPLGDYWQRNVDANGNYFNYFGPLSSSADLRMYRVNTDSATGLTPEQLNPELRTISVNPNSPVEGTEILMIGLGNGRIVNANDTGKEGLYHYSVDMNTDPWTWPQFASNHGGNVHGFRRAGSDSRLKRWGTNAVSLDSVVEQSWGVSDADNNIVTTTNGGVDTLTIFTQFDRPPSSGGIVDSDEALAATGDSGGPVFLKDAGGHWQLAGIMTNVFTLSGQAEANLLGRGFYGQGTAFADLSNPHYYQQIANLRAQTNYSLVGDINLDGIVSGNGTGAWETDDVTAFIQGWLHSQPDANILSWKKGDLNQDGVTDLADFALLRNALGGSINNPQVEAFFGSGTSAVPEPQSWALMLGIWSGLMWLFRRRRLATVPVRRRS